MTKYAGWQKFSPISEHMIFLLTKIRALGLKVFLLKKKESKIKNLNINVLFSNLLSKKCCRAIIGGYW